MSNSFNRIKVHNQGTDFIKIGDRMIRPGDAAELIFSDDDTVVVEGVKTIVPSAPVAELPAPPAPPAADDSGVGSGGTDMTSEDATASEAAATDGDAAAENVSEDPPAPAPAPTSRRRR